ncbi:NAD(P)-binding protein [Ascobolus immersus RN42]|uniref:NAD(P)-binding protein n=1 Tax=Ascobolus immersus RN42 TaxID=1160509 RepID=A0A3N4J0C0_ASCIM|nr:NAD(P)-binding protein [Ascobolus immersus RN42]
MPNVLLLGGHGKVALQITRILAQNGHTITSVIRNADHIPDIKSAAGPGKESAVTPLVASIEESTDESAKELVGKGFDWVIWSAGAGGKGGPSRTKAIDEDGANRFSKAIFSTPSVKKYLMVSASCSRSKPAPWWSDSDVESFKGAWKAIPVYCEAKLAADRFILEESKRSGWGGEWFDLRPGALTDEPGKGKVDLGKAKQGGSVSRENVAKVAVGLLESHIKVQNGGTWLDLLDGEEDVDKAVERVLKEGVDVREE